MKYILLALIIFFVIRAITAQRGSRQMSQPRRPGLKSQPHDIEASKKLADEDVTVFGEELQNLHIETMTTELDTAMRQDYQRALNSYETAKQRLSAATEPDHIKSVTAALEDGRYAMACVLARQNGEPLPVRRAPCFFNPQHGPSTTDVEWAPPGGQPRSVPVCGADADRVKQGAEPDIRTVQHGFQTVPYWRGGAGYQPYAMGYYDPYLSMMPTFFAMTMLNSMWMGGMVNDFDTGYDAGYDAGYGDGSGGSDGSGDSGGDAGAGDSGGGDSGGGDYGGGDGGGGWFGGGDGGGGFDGGGFDGGGF